MQQVFATEFSLYHPERALFFRASFRANPSRAPASAERLRDHGCAPRSQRRNRLGWETPDPRQRPWRAKLNNKRHAHSPDRRDALEQGETGPLVGEWLLSDTSRLPTGAGGTLFFRYALLLAPRFSDPSLFSATCSRALPEPGRRV